jgi:hypothetical protein
VTSSTKSKGVTTEVTTPLLIAYLFMMQVVLPLLEHLLVLHLLEHLLVLPLLEHLLEHLLVLHSLHL